MGRALIAESDADVHPDVHVNATDGDTRLTELRSRTDRFLQRHPEVVQ